MSLNKYQRDAVLEKINSIAQTKQKKLQEDYEAELAKLPNPFVQFFAKIAGNKAASQAFCKAMAEHLEADYANYSDEYKIKSVQALFFAVVMQNTKSDYDYHSNMWYNVTATELFRYPELDAFVQARNDKVQAIQDKYTAREKELESARQSMCLKIKLTDVPEELLNLLDTFERRTF